jgi:adenylate cyclase
MAGKPETCAVMFADLAGSTALYDKLGDASAKAAVQTAMDKMAVITQANGGRVIKTIGDEVLAVYPTADQAAAAALAMQMDTSLRLGGAVGLRIGFHLGEVIAENNDVFGDVVNVAARLTGSAKTGQILTSDQAVARLTGDMAERARAFDFVQVKGKTRPLHIFEILWEKAGSFTQMVTHLEKAGVQDDGGAATRLELAAGARTLKLDEDQMPFTLGREAGCNLIVQATKASRVHAKFEYRRGKFVITDQSTNGTYVGQEGGAEVFLRRESMPLVGHGTISLGSPSKLEPDSVIRYAVT